MQYVLIVRRERGQWVVRRQRLADGEFDGAVYDRGGSYEECLTRVRGAPAAARR